MPDSPALLIYGASGYTGGLCARRAVEAGLRPILAGRGGPRLAGLANELGLEQRVTSLSDPGGMADMLSGVSVLLNAAGPFSITALPLAHACLRSGTHYADLNADVAMFEALLGLDARAQKAGVMLLPGVGFDVVASDCLALHVARRAEKARRLRIAIGGLALVSRGSAKGLIEEAGRSTRIRRNGEIVSLPPGSLEAHFDFGEGPRPGVAVSWGDVVTAYRTTGVPDIEVYFEALAPVRMLLLASRSFGWLLGNPLSQVLLKTSTALLPEGPSEDERATREVVVVAEAERDDGAVVRSRLRTPEAYTFSGRAALAIVQRMLEGQVAAGFQTPAGRYGADFVLEIEGVRREDPAEEG